MQRESAACLRELGRAVEECLRFLAGSELEAGELRERAGGLLSRLEEKRASENYADLLNEAARYRDFYVAEAQRLKRRWVEQRTAEHRREHRRRHLAAQIRADLREIAASPEAEEILRQLESPTDDWPSKRFWRKWPR
jgi:chromatin segregation and condensation protein Rec8/ScpA/Scc1 (kleisin family)